MGYTKRDGLRKEYEVADCYQAEVGYTGRRRS